jgi:hypothetical protein
MQISENTRKIRARFTSEISDLEKQYGIDVEKELSILEKELFTEFRISRWAETLKVEFERVDRQYLERNYPNFEDCDHYREIEVFAVKVNGLIFFPGEIDSIVHDTRVPDMIKEGLSKEEIMKICKGSIVAKSTGII